MRSTARTITVTEYLQGEKGSPVRHEYVDGQVYAMAGASDRHNRLSLNVASRLSDHLGAGPCQVFISDMKIMADDRVYYYPDVTVTCGPPGADPYFRTQPVLIVEVTSPGAERIDSNEKLFAYKRIPSLLEYVLISQDQMLVQIHRRVERDRWEIETLSEPLAKLRLESVGLTLGLDDIYRNSALG